MIYCLTILLTQQVVSNEDGLLDTIHEFAWGSTADEACAVTVEALRGYGIEVKGIVQRAIAGDQDVRRYPIPELIHGLPWHLMELASARPDDRKLH